MKLPDVIEKWKVDSKIDQTDLIREGQRIPSLHSEYLGLWANERAILKSIDLKIKTLECEKHEFYLQGPSKETREKGWTYPASGKVLRNDLDLYMNADKQLQELIQQKEIQVIKVDTLKVIVDQLNFRSNLIRALMEHERFQSGVS